MRNTLKLSIATAILTSFCAYAQAQEAPAADSPAQTGVAAPAQPTHLPPYDCTLTEAVLCKAGATCTPSKTLGEMPLPARVLLHFEQEVMAGNSADGLPHVSKINTLAQSGDIVVAQGIDGGTGWMVHTTHNDDEVTFVAASDDFVINAFGTCKPLGVTR